MKHIVLTLSGKEDVSIIASSMKNFEALSNFYCQAAEKGDTSIIKERTIAGIKTRLLANT
jgi:hypothetical protein